jgi:hypothetical protein
MGFQYRKNSRNNNQLSHKGHWTKIINQNEYRKKTLDILKNWVLNFPSIFALLVLPF